jgi:hypothetical protein
MYPFLRINRLTSYVLGQSDDIMLEKDDASIDVDEKTFMEDAI